MDMGMGMDIGMDNWYGYGYGYGHVATIWGGGQDGARVPSPRRTAGRAASRGRPTTARGAA